MVVIYVSFKRAGPAVPLIPAAVFYTRLRIGFTDILEWEHWRSIDFGLKVVKIIVKFWFSC